VRLQLFRSIKHQIDLVLGVSLPNVQAYRTNPQKSEEIEFQVQKLLDKVWIQKNFSPCVVLVLLETKKVENEKCVVSVEPSRTL